MMTLDKINNVNYDYCECLHPTKLRFIVNKNSAITKVFDTQKITSAKMSKQWSDNFFVNKIMAFTTDIVDRVQRNPVGYTDREGNLLYDIPREKELSYGYRIRGRWMQVDMQDNDPDKTFAISHVITKFRQSFS